MDRDWVLPEIQHIEIGDIIPDGKPGTVFFTVEAFEPNRNLVLHTNSHIRTIGLGFLRGSPLEPNGEITWVFYLYQYKPNQTRLILRTRARYEPWLIKFIIWPFFMLGEYLFPRQILLGIKRRVETLPFTLSNVAQI